ncbi:M56 family metallopeptidase [Pedobacter sp. PLR]|uniref:M56 family metallopeptidase n=1 Tax=Pedobacter sp. PLR TaxID=2994465 RepID=UPI0022481B30|nr:M56 family metallopeptidase [Pedobacter sp. PLR]MCX2453481.1 M56 family metallopeptidase [Pedobacter sp. PLR]
MMNWFYYLLEANLYLAVFYGCYRLLLHKETFYSANRFFLILSTLMAFSLPLLQMGYLNQLFETGVDQQVGGILVGTSSNEPEFSILNLAIYLLYVGVAIAFSLKLLRDLYQIFALSKRSDRFQKDKVTYISLNQHNVAFSFFNLLFIQPDIQGKETILKHELVHIRQRHSLDIIFFEVIQILNWFNPITYLIKKDIKLLHEYIADEQTTLKEIEKYDYALFLIKNSFGMEANPLSNHIFNQSILKQRINMLNKEKSTGRARLKLLLALPIAAVMLGTSTMAFTKDYSLVDLYPEKVTSNIGSAETLKPIPFSGVQEPVKTKVQKTTKSSGVPPASKSPAVQPPPPPPPVPAVPPAPPTKAAKVRFPPPIVRPDKKPVKKTSGTIKIDNIKFPPPIVTPDKKAKLQPPTIPVEKIPAKKEQEEPHYSITVKEPTKESKKEAKSDIEIRP